MRHKFGMKSLLENSMTYDVIVVGAGLAGATTALFLGDADRVLLVDAHEPAAGASAVATGLMSPMMSRKGNPVWQVDEALDAFNEINRRLGSNGFLQGTGVLRPAANEEQAAYFQRNTAKRPELATWVRADVARERWPWLRPGSGVMHVRMGGAVAIASWTRALVGAAAVETRFGTALVSWTSGPGFVRARFSDGTECEAERLVLCTGQATPHIQKLNRLNLHMIKGQTVRLRKPAGLAAFPPISTSEYLVDEGETVYVGSTFEHEFEHGRPTESAATFLRERASRAIPSLKDAFVLEQFAGIRATVPGTRLPMLGPLPGEENIWVFGGLGSKGLLMSALLARRLPAYFGNPSSIPTRLRVAERPGIL